MTIDDVLALARAGYTREEIAALNTPAASIAAEATPAASIAAEAAPAASIAAEATPAWAEALNANIAALTQRVTAMNLGGAIPAQQPQTVDAILAEIIAPQPKK